jgi:hypothetical protein
MGVLKNGKGDRLELVALLIWPQHGPHGVDGDRSSPAGVQGKLKLRFGLVKC